MTSIREDVFPPGIPTRVVNGKLVYTPAIIVTPGRLVLLSGMLARDAAGNLVGKGDMAAQIRQIGENLKMSLAAAGASLGDLVRTLTFTTDIEEFLRHGDIRSEYFGAAPTSTTVEVRRLSHPDFLVEMETMAILK